MDDGTLTVDCRSCPVREQHCDGCMVAVLLSSPPQQVWEAPVAAHDPSLPDALERRALAALTRAGLIDEEEARSAVAVPGSGARWAQVG